MSNRKLIERMEKKQVRKTGKVRNVKSVVKNGIKFRSELEGRCYSKLVENGFNPDYEAIKFMLFEGFKPEDNLRLYLPKYKAKRIVGFERNTSKVQAISYTPDFVFEHKDYYIVIETKGHPNDAYPLRRKMFFDLLRKTIARDRVVLFFEPHNLGQIEKTIEIIKSL